MGDAAFLPLAGQPGWHVRLHPKALTPDPTYGNPVPGGESIDFRIDVFPWKLVCCRPSQPAAEVWAQTLTGDADPGALVLAPAPDGRIDLALDFGTEVEGCLEVVFDAPSRCTGISIIGEALVELDELLNSENPRPRELRHFHSAGRNVWRREQRGFRFVRLVFLDVEGAFRIRQIRADAQFVFKERRGDFRCGDARLQRAWQTSVYTARLCTRPDTFWDGIKRDRSGWFGDARIIKDAVDCVFHDPRPSCQMLSSLPMDNWVCGVPVYSFDAIAMLRQHILAFGLGEVVIPEAYARIKQFLAWVAEKQLNADGFITRDPSLNYFADIGFLDWSKMPVGGRFEELSWLQCKHVEGLRSAAAIAGWLGRADDAALWNERADRIGKRIVEVFYRSGQGFLHTLNHIGEVENPHVPGWGGHYQRTYVDGIRLGPSGPSRQCNAFAVWAGVADEKMRAELLKNVFGSQTIEPVITAYFLYYEQMARAMCGDPVGAIRLMGEYVAGMLENRDAATLIEMYDPRMRDFRRFCNHFSVFHKSPLSYCHGWGAGLVPLMQRHMMGLSPLAPGWDRLAIEPPAELPFEYEASVPTPHGIVKVAQEAGGRPRFRLPHGIELAVKPSDVKVDTE